MRPVGYFIILGCSGVFKVIGQKPRLPRLQAERLSRSLVLQRTRGGGLGGGGGGGRGDKRLQSITGIIFFFLPVRSSGSKLKTDFKAEHE